KSTAIASRSTRQTELKQDARGTVEKDELESDEEADKSRSDALWADFLGDVGGAAESKPAAKPKEKPATPAKKVESEKRSTAPAPKPAAAEVLDEQVTVLKSSSSGSSSSSASSSSSSSSSAKENQEKPATTPRGFAAGKRPANGAGGAGAGLGSLLNQLGKKKKMSVLEKSQLDWKSFKSEEGIDEELRTHNKGKDGYLERQDFLQRTDLRQFEIEKGMRQTRRQN
ncbi:hypothetical protein KR222_000057, partial [Zaprionus bogoriensis]